MRSTSKKRSRINVTYEYIVAVEDLSNNRNIIILQQSKGRGVEHLGSKYFDKCFDMLNTEQLTNNPTNYTEKKLQHNLRKLEHNLSKDIYTKRYPTGSSPTQLNGTVKINNLLTHGKVDDLPV